MNPLDKILTRVLDTVVAAFFAAILVTTLLQLTLRYGFNKGVLGGNELMEFLFIYTTALGAALAVHRRQHISISFILVALPRSLYRIVDAFGWLAVAFLNAILIWTSISWIRQVGGNESPVMRIPEWTVQISIPIGCGLVILYCLNNAAMSLIQDRHTVAAFPPDGLEGQYPSGAGQDQPNRLIYCLNTRKSPHFWAQTGNFRLFAKNNMKENYGGQASHDNGVSGY